MHKFGTTIPEKLVGMPSNIDVFVDDQALKEVSATRSELIGSIDQGTSSTRFIAFTKKGVIAASAQIEHTQIFPAGEDKAGWHEHDPLEIWNNTVACITAIKVALKSKKIDLEKRPLKAIGITNQRETTIAWNAETGVPYFNAIVWDDLRTTKIASNVAQGDVDRLREKTGLPLASYFAGTKVRWLLDNIPELQSDLADSEKRDHVRFGTIDTWLLYQLTGEHSSSTGAANRGGVFVTDVSNASRWLFLNLSSMAWDRELIDTVCHPYSLPLTALPAIYSSSEVYGVTNAKSGVPMSGVPIAAILGDQQAALFGQAAFTAGEAKCTYGTGLFLMMNTEDKLIKSTNGLLTTVGYQLGPTGPVHYALEGSVSHSGSTIQWLRDRLQIITKASESEVVAKTTESNDGLYFVPAFAGLFAPHWRSDARACIVGMTATHTRGHVCRAALEATAYQARELFDAIFADSNVTLKALKVDGGGTNNRLLMQFQADMINVPVIKPVVLETTALGAAFAAGLAVGVWKDVDEIRELWSVAETFEPVMDASDRQKYWKGWQKAIGKSLGWIDIVDDGNNINDEDSYETAVAQDDEVKTASSESITNGKIVSKRNAAGFSTWSLACTGLCAVSIGFLLGRSRK